MDIQMSPQRPYLLKAMYDWLVDNHCTPHLVVDATADFVEVPQEHVQDGQIVLNVHPAAVMNFSLDNEHLGFEARFGGVPRRIWVPIAAVTAIYARENGAGTIFEAEPGLEVSAPKPAQPEKITGVESNAGDGPQKSTKDKKGKPTLKVVK